MNSQTDSTLTRVGPIFGSIVCGVDGSRPSHEAARQAALLTDPGAVRAYVAVSCETGVGATSQATLTHEHAREYLRAARDLDASLVVTGSRGLSGLASLHSVSERIAHAAPCSVLVVRR